MKHIVYAKLINISVIVLSLFSYSFVRADHTFPYSYTIFQSLPGGRLFVYKLNGSYRSFFVKPTFGEFAESVFFWNGVRRDSVIGVPTVPPSIVAANQYGNSLLFISTEDNRLFASLLNTSSEIVSSGEFPDEQGFYSFEKVFFLGQSDNGEVLVQVDNKLYLLKILDTSIVCRLISRNVVTACFLKHPKYKIATVNFEFGNGYLYLIDSLGLSQLLCRVDISDELKLSQVGNRLIAISSSKFYNSSLIQVASFEYGIVNKFWIESKAERITINSEYPNIFLYYLKNLGTQYIVEKVKFDTNFTRVTENFIFLSPELSEPYGLYLHRNQIFCIFRNGLTVVSLDDEIIAKDLITFGESFPDKVDLTYLDNYLILSSKSYSLVLSEQKNPFWVFSRFFDNFGKILIPLVLLLMLTFVVRKFYKQRLLLKSLIEVPTTGVVFVVDKFGRLLTANNSGKEMLGITESVPLRRLFSYYCISEHLKGLNELVEKIIQTRESFVQKITFVQNKTDYEWLFTLQTLKSLTGNFKGAIITGIDITEVLGRQKLSNLAQLAHDMQTNLSTIRLNAEQLETNDALRNEERKRKIIHQVGLLIQRVRDIVTVGRGELVRQNVDVFDICMDARSEFDVSMFPNVEFELDLQHFEINCDKQKMVRAVRNAIENAIKAFQGKSGIITLKCWKDNRNAFISIKDNGPGMDEAVLAKFMKPYFTTGGTGIGTMIIQHVIELHGGSLKVISEKGKGTELIFIIPFLIGGKKMGKDIVETRKTN